MLEIRKKGLKHFRHYEGSYDPYSANDIKIIFDGNIVKLRSVSGRVIFDKDGYLFSDVRIYDDTDAGTEESFPNIESLVNRLVILGYPFLGTETTIIVDSVDWGAIGGNIENQADLIAELNNINGGTP